MILCSEAFDYAYPEDMHGRLHVLPLPALQRKVVLRLNGLAGLVAYWLVSSSRYHSNTMQSSADGRHQVDTCHVSACHTDVPASVSHSK